MKKLYTLVAAVLLTAISFAQSPEKMSYQAVVRDSGDALVANQAVRMQISILQGSAVGTAVYTETQSPTTNINGLVSFEIGNGMIVSGTFAAIDWSAGPYFIKTETDPTGGSSYSITGTSQLLSVPFALYSANTAGLDLKADKASPTFTGDVIFDTNGVSFNGGNVAFDNGQTFVRSAQVFNSAENFFYGPSVEFNTATNFATGTLNILNSPQAIGNVLTDVNGDGVATWQAPVTSTIADGSITEVKLAFDTATQTELNLKADIDSPTFTGNVGIGADLNIVGNMFADGGLFLNSWDVYANPGVFNISESGVAPHFNIIPGGNIGIGTVSPDYIMDIEGTGGPRARIYSNDNFYAGLLTQNATHQYFVGTQGTFEAAGGTNSGFHIYDNTVGAQRLVIDANGNIGINNFAPVAKLDIVGTVKIVDGTEGAGKVLTSDVDGLASWQLPTAGSIADGSITEAKLAFDTATQDELDLKAPLLNPSFTGNITTIGDGSGMFYELNPAANYFKFQGNNHAKMSGAAWLSLQIGAVDKLLVTGSSVIAKDDFIAETNIETPSIKVTGGSLIIGNVLTSDASGNATWQAPIAGSIADGSITEAKLAFDTATQAELNALLDGAIKTNSDNIQFIMGPGGPIDNLTYGQSTNTDNITTNSNAIIAKANLANPTFTGIVTTPALKVASGAGVNKVLTSDASGNATWQTATAGSIADGSITVAKLSTSVNTSLDLADTSVQPAALNAKANLVSPAFTTPSLGVATATSINGVVLVNGGDDAAYLNAQGTYTVPAGGAAPTTYVVGSNYAELGGIVVWVSSNGQHGLVVEASDMNNTPVTWYNAQNLISEPSNHYGAANQFRDWRLPTKFELTEIYSLFGTSLWGWYWTSTEVNSLTAFALELNGGGPIVDYQWAKDRTTNSNVRAVRAF